MTATGRSESNRKGLSRVAYVGELVEDISAALRECGIEGEVRGSAEGNMPVTVSTPRSPTALQFFASAAYARYATGRESYDQSTEWFLSKVAGLGPSGLTEAFQRAEAEASKERGGAPCRE